MYIIVLNLQSWERTATAQSGSYHCGVAGAAATPAPVLCWQRVGSPAGIVACAPTLTALVKPYMLTFWGPETGPSNTANPAPAGLTFRAGLCLGQPTCTAGTGTGGMVAAVRLAVTGCLAAAINGSMSMAPAATPCRDTHAPADS